jgi:hypothetical protein
MKKIVAFALLTLCTCGLAYAKEPRFYQKGRLVSMEAVSCGYAENSGKSIMGEIVGTDGAHKNTKEMLCQEYVLRSDRVLYRIRPRDEKHPVLLPIGEDAEFRLQKDKQRNNNRHSVPPPQSSSSSRKKKAGVRAHLPEKPR